MENININNPSKTIVKRKLKLPMVFAFIIIILCIFGSIKIIQTFNDKNDNKIDHEKEENKTLDNDKDSAIEEVIKEDETKVSKKTKLYKEEYKDRYDSYKEKHSDLSDEKIVLYVNIGIDQEFYTNTKDSLRTGTTLALVNKFYYLDRYVPNDLVEINSQYKVSGKEVKMTKEAAAAFEKLAEAAKKDGLTVRAMSTYRSYDYQNTLYTNYANKDGKEKADTYSARAGYSEHQTGLAVDVDNAKVSYTSFGSTNEFTWMKNHAHEYGFILRYTAENEFITGYKNEPWHYRYVGVEIATQMKKENISSYEEYYFMYLDN